MRPGRRRGSCRARRAGARVRESLAQSKSRNTPGHYGGGHVVRGRAQHDGGDDHAQRCDRRARRAPDIKLPAGSRSGHVRRESGARRRRDQDDERRPARRRRHWAAPCLADQHCKQHRGQHRDSHDPAQRPGGPHRGDPPSGSTSAGNDAQRTASASGPDRHRPGDQRQVHRWAGRMLAMTASTCIPQPDQVIFPQRAQRAGLHMGHSSNRCT